MGPADLLCFGEFLLDFCNDCVWREQEQLKLTAKAFAVLCYLATHPTRIVSKTELFHAVWPGIVVSDWALATCVREIRRVLRDPVKTPRIIETVYKRGYRFIAPLTTIPLQQGLGGRDWTLAPSPLPTPESRAPNLKSHVSCFVGRDAELSQLHTLLDNALRGERQIVFITGEPGIGKTTLVEAFLRGVQHLGPSTQDFRSLTFKAQYLRPSPWIARGQCVEQYGAGEAYLPVLEALGRLGRTEAGTALKAVLEQYAPTWLLHLPALLSAEEAAELQPRILGVMQERMVREFAEALEVLTAKQPLVLVFEDLHWADATTLMLLSVLAHRQEPARLLILGTYRSTEAAREESPLLLLTQELTGHHLSHEVALSLFDEEAIAAYLEARFPTSLLPTRLARVLYQRTEGNPLFVVSIIHDLITRGIIAQTECAWVLNGDLGALLQETPDEIRQLVTSQRVRLQPKTRRVLEAASVAGMEFSTAEVAAALETAVAAVEEQCARLAERQQFLRPAGISKWPDHTVAARYAFLHAVYQTVWHERVSPTRLQEWHRRIGERKEAAYGERAGEIAAELAVHFEQGREYNKVLHYLNQAAGIALRRSANPEAIHYLKKALTMLEFLPDTLERTQQELQLQVTLGAPLMMTKGYTSPEVKDVYDRAWELCQKIGETPQLFPVLVGRSRFYYGRTSAQHANGLEEQLLTLAHRGQDPSLLLVAHMMLSGNLFFQGEFPQAHLHAQQGMTLYDPRRHRALIFQYGDDPEVLCLCWAALALWYLGYPDQAVARIYQALRIAQELAHPFGLAFARFWTAFLYQSRREVQSIQEQTEALLTLTQTHGIPQFAAMDAMLSGWALAEQGQAKEGIVKLRQGLADLRAMGQELGRPYFLALLAEAYRQEGQIAEGMQVLTEALAIADKTGECMHQAELYRLKGELTLQKEARDGKPETSLPPSRAPSLKPQVSREAAQEAKGYFLKAIEIARRQNAKSLELRAVMSLSRLWRQQGKQREARRRLAEIYGWFTEGFDTIDLREAQTLLAELH